MHFIRPALMLLVGLGLVIAGVSAWFRYGRSFKANPRMTMSTDVVVSSGISPWATGPALGAFSIVVGCVLMFFGGLLLVGAVHLHNTCVEGGGAMMEGVCKYGAAEQGR